MPDVTIGWFNGLNLFLIYFVETRFLYEMLCDGRRGRLQQTANASLNLILLQPHREVSRLWPGGGSTVTGFCEKAELFVGAVRDPSVQRRSPCATRSFCSCTSPLKNSYRFSTAIFRTGSLKNSYKFSIAILRTGSSWQPRTFMVAAKNTLNTRIIGAPSLLPLPGRHWVWYSLQILESRAFNRGCQREDSCLQATVWTNLYAVVATSSWELVVQFSTDLTAIPWFCYISVSSALKIAFLQISLDTWCLQDLTWPAWTHLGT